MADTESIAVESGDQLESAGTGAISYEDTIATAISALKDEGEAAYERREDEGHFWTFKYGTVNVFVHLTGETETDTFTVWSPVLALPSKDDAALAMDLLRKNWLETSEAQFAVWDDRVVVCATRSLEDTSVGEVARVITIVATMADYYDEVLIAEYGA
ncbi:YbjN domain-containing protein [Synechococcus sp. PCC 7336]|uniref:YbjN domain-containing protein n=1 Tax=Synechococcus sp. PCC 7336 TaxID=195250 RepID=UPI00034DCB54|nr:YbjN domain-containing protein [Synechococcus sp. PCC 7336]